jgi:hypothetical protein
MFLRAVTRGSAARILQKWNSSESSATATRKMSVDLQEGDNSNEPSTDPHFREKSGAIRRTMSVCGNGVRSYERLFLAGSGTRD